VVKPPHVYVITDRAATGGRPLGQVVAAALQAAHGARAGAEAARFAVQLREKDLGGRELLELAVELRAITRAAGAALYVNDRVDVALACGADGVHLGGGSLAPADVRRIAPGLACAVSAHTRADLEAAQAAGVEFAVFGPVFDTPSKRALGSPVGIAGLRAAVAGLALPVLALGGIDNGNARSCVQAGAAGLACVRAVIAAGNPALALSLFLSGFDGNSPVIPAK
jgi:thiamine-phosphate pyrophosphorylase